MQKWLLAVTVVLATMVGFTAQAESLPNTMLFTNLSGQEVEWPKELPGKKRSFCLLINAVSKARWKIGLRKWAFRPRIILSKFY